MAKATTPRQKPINKRRAQRLAKTMGAIGEYNIAVERESAIIDLLTDVRHLCDKRGEDFDQLNRVAHDHYLHEILEND